MNPTLEPIGKNIWCLHQDLNLMGVNFGTRMTVVRMKGGGLWIHSPIRPTEEIQKILAGLGPIKFVVAPNIFHHLYVKYYGAAKPTPHFSCAPGLEKKRSDIKFDLVLNEGAHPPWESEIQWMRIEGTLSSEVVFYHPESKTLILTDFIFNMGRQPKTWQNWMLTLLRSNKCGPSLMARLFITNKKKASACLKQVQQWDFENITLAHGALVLGSGTAVFKKAFQDLVGGK